MYEEKPKKSLNNLNINWKSLLIKLGILLIAVFIILCIVSLVKKDKKVESNLSTNLQSMRTAAKEYFVGSKLPTNVNGRKKITLGEMFDNKLVVEFKDQNNKSCDTIGSFAEATKVNETDYSIKVKLVCGSESDYIIDTIKIEDNNVDIPTDNDGNTNQDNNQNVSDNNQSNNVVTKPNNGTTTKPSTNTNSTKKPNTSNNNTVASNTCTYGNKDYTSTYPLAYIIPGNCAVSKSDYYKAEYANKVSQIMAAEYKKLNNELVTLKSKTGANLYVETPISSGIYNKANTGLVGYQLLFTMKEKRNYVTTTVYQYYLDSNGNRTVLIDKRNSISSSGNNNNNNNNSNSSNNVVRVKSVSLNTSSVNLKEGETTNLSVTINPSNATNKNVTWTSSNSAIASVNNGKVTALKEGTATITATVDGKSAKAYIYVSRNNINTGRYCKYEEVYSSGYMDVSDTFTKTSDTYTYRVALNTNYRFKFVTPATNLVTYNDYVSSYNYWKTKNGKLNLSSPGGTVIDPGSAIRLRDSALKAKNFTPSVKYTGANGNTLYFDITVNLKSLHSIDGAVPFNSNGKSVYFLPLKFNVVYDSCVNVNDNEATYYINNGYVRVTN